MNSKPDVHRAAQILGQARLDRRPLGPLPDDCRPNNEAEGFAIQEALHRWQAEAGLGGQAGYKIACTAAAMQELLGIDAPCVGGILAANLYDHEVVFPMSGFVHVGIECEVAMRLASDVAASGAPYSGDGMVEHVEACMAAAEIVDNRYEDFRSFGVPCLIADDFFCAGAVVGEPVKNWREIDLKGVTGTTRIDGVEGGRGCGADVMGHPLEALAWLANTLAAHGRSLKRGDLVLTGSMVVVQWLDGPADVEVLVDGLGQVRIRFDEG